MKDSRYLLLVTRFSTCQSNKQNLATSASTVVGHEAVDVVMDDLADATPSPKAIHEGGPWEYVRYSLRLYV